ncbi:MAG: CoA transferase [Candidatus Thermoplasmatota archaeon]|nr:CoA transferase [Candidatus Thermoplasmatota archaeon]MCL5789141.1 CoA transferase [Candidatus Thermoplasmatota archaeon]
MNSDVKRRKGGSRNKGNHSKVNLPLEGVKILDASRVLAGPFCSMLLSDLGAEVIRVEDREKGDETRYYQPLIGRESSYYLSINRNKKVLFLNLKERNGRERLYSLIRKSDVFIHNFLPRVEEELGVGYDTIRSKNGKIIYVTISGYGREGKRASLPGYDILMQGESGLMSVTGMDENNLARIGNSTVDIYTAYLCATTILAYLYSSAKRGERGGTRVDIPLIGSAIYSMPFLFGYLAATGENPKPAGTAHPGIVPYQPFDTKDRKLIIAVANNNQWGRFCAAINRPDLVNDERFRTNEQRVKHRDELIPLLEQIMIQKRASQWIRIFNGRSIPVAPINRLTDVMNEMSLSSFIERRNVRGKEMLFTKFPASIDGKRIQSFRRNPPTHRK